MGRAVFLLLTFALLVELFATLVTSDSEPFSLAHPNIEFTVALYRKIVDVSVGKNVFLSPIAISTALAMVFAGAEGNTKFQMLLVMRLSPTLSSGDYINVAFKDIIKNLKISSSSSILHLASRLYGQAGSKFRIEYVRALSSYYGTALEALDFMRDSCGARNVMNNWVSNVTSNKITELFPEGSITRDTKLVLASAAYFKGSWIYKFDRRATQLQTFHLSKSEKTKVPMMKLGPTYGILYMNSTDLGCQVLELQYIGKKISMYVFLPHENQGLSSVEERLNAWNVKSITQGMIYSYVSVSMPKFLLEHTLDLKESLQAIGILDVFDVKKANLSRIVDSGNLSLSRVMQKASIAVDEMGTDAIASPGISIKVKSSRKPIDFTVDRPFMFLVMEKTTTSILFLGRVTNPPNAY